MAEATETHKINPTSAAELQSLAVLNETESLYNSRVDAEAEREIALATFNEKEKAKREQIQLEEIYQLYIPTIKQQLIESAQRGQLIIAVRFPLSYDNVREEIVNNWFSREPEWCMPIHKSDPLETELYAFAWRDYNSYLWFDLRAQHEIKPIK